MTMSPSFLRFKTLALALLSATHALDLPEYVGLKTSLNASILEVTLHNPNSVVNFWSQDTTDGLSDLVERLRNDNDTKVVIFKSDVPQFFVAHYDLASLSPSKLS
jgi:enoyl-CoA hydratase/carnithine racemase